MLPPDSAAGLAAAILQFRSTRSEVLPVELFGEPGWDLILELFLADAESRLMTARQVSEKRGIAPTVMSRWLKLLSAQGLTVGDGTGNIDDPLTLSGSAMQKIEHLLTRAEDLKSVLEGRTPKPIEP